MWKRLLKLRAEQETLNLSLERETTVKVLPESKPQNFYQQTESECGKPECEAVFYLSTCIPWFT